MSNFNYNSKFKQNSYDTSTNFSFYLVESIKIKKYVKLVDASIPDSCYLIHDDNNQFKIIFSDNTAKTITFTNGNNIYTSLASFITSNVNYNNFVITFSTITIKVTFTSSSLNFTIYFVNNCVNKILGFNENINYSSNSLTLTSPNVLDIIIPTMLYICIDNLYNPNIISNNNLNITFVVPVTSSKNNVIYFCNNNMFDNIVFCENINLNSLKIKLLTDDNEIYENNNLDLQMVLMHE